VANSPSRPAGALPLSTRLLYGSGTIAFGVKDHGFNALLMLFYNQVVGLPAAWVGSAIMIAMIADALFDPLLGQYSDNVRTRWGRRHPFMYAAALPIAASYLLLWNAARNAARRAICVAGRHRDYRALFDQPL